MIGTPVVECNRADLVEFCPGHFFRCATQNMQAYDSEMFQNLLKKFQKEEQFIHCLREHMFPDTIESSNSALSPTFLPRLSPTHESGGGVGPINWGGILSVFPSRFWRTPQV